MSWTRPHPWWTSLVHELGPKPDRWSGAPGPESGPGGPWSTQPIGPRGRTNANLVTPSVQTPGPTQLVRPVWSTAAGPAGGAGPDRSSALAAGPRPDQIVRARTRSRP